MRRPRAGAPGLLLLGPALLGAAWLIGCTVRRSVELAETGGSRVAFELAGRGSPAVVFDAGLGDPMIVWSEVFPRVAELTTVLAWDRPGIGRSGPPRDARTSARIVRELHELLENAAVPPPWLLVGHSFGGMNAQLFARTYPTETAGIVLVDATHSDFRAAEERLRSPGEMVALGERFSKLGLAARAEFDAIPASSAQIRAAAPMPDIPLVVITAARHADPVPALENLWGDLQSDLVTLNARGRQVLATRSGHSVMYDEPDVVVETIRDMLAELRAGSRGSIPDRAKRSDRGRS